MFSKFILAFAIALHRAATKVRISAHVLTTHVAAHAAQKASDRADAASRALEAMRLTARMEDEYAMAVGYSANKIRQDNFRVIEMLENPAL